MSTLTIGSVVTQMYNSAVDFAASKTTVLVPDGQDLAGVLLLIVASWAIFQWLLTGDGVEALMSSFGAFTRYAIVAVMLAGWTTVVGGFMGGLFTDLSTKVSGGATVGVAAETMVSSARNLFMDRRVRPPCVGDNANAADPEAALQTGACIEAGRGAEPTIFDVLFNLPMVLMTLLLQLVGLVLMIIMTAAFLLMVFLSEAMFALAMTFGPVLIPWLIWQRTEFLFDGWLRFMIVALFVKLVAFWMLGFTAGIVAAARAIANQVPLANASEYLAVNELAAFGIAVVAALGAFLMWQVPGLAQGLISGSAGVSGQRFGQGAVSKRMRASPAQAMNATQRQLADFSKALSGSKK